MSRATNPEVFRVQDHCQKVHLPVIVVFETAYMWRFGKLTNIENEVRRYREHCIVPRYLLSYLDHLEKNDGI